MPMPMGKSEVVIWHNPRCSKSREALALIRAAGIEPRIVEYLKTPPSRDEIKAVANKLGLSPAGLLRRKEAPFAELDLARDGIADDAVLDAIAAHPVLIERPVVITAKGVRIGRPPEKIREVLP